MKVAIYWEQNSWGGVDSHLLTLLSTWPEPKDEFVIFYNKGNLGLKRIKNDLEKIQNIKLSEVVSYSFNEIISRLPSSLLFKWIRPLIYFLQPVLFVIMVFRLKFIIKSEQGIEVIIANNGGYPAAWGCLSWLVAGKKAGISNCLLLVHHEATRPSMFMGLYERFIDRIVANSIDAIICPSYATRQTLLDNRWFNAELSRIRVIYNAVKAKASSTATVLPEIENLRNMTNDRNISIIGIVGRVEPYKGHEDIIFAISRLDPEYKKNIKLVIIGLGSASEILRLEMLALKFNVSDNVFFLGYLSGSSIDIISQLDLLIVATRSFEGFGLTIAESMVAGTPVLATKVGAIPEILNSSVATLVNPCSPRELSDAMSDFLTNNESWLKNAELAKEYIKSIGFGMAEEYRRLIVECDD